MAAEAFGLTLSPAVAVVCADALADVPVAALGPALTAAVAAECYVRTPKAIVSTLRLAAGYAAPKPEDHGRAEELAAWAAAEAWAKRYANRLRNPETGALEWSDWRDYSTMPWKRDPGPTIPLPARIEHALRQIGGPDAIQRNWSEQDQHWLRDRFCEAYRLAPAIEDAQMALGAGTGEVKRLVANLSERVSMEVTSAK